MRILFFIESLLPGGKERRLLELIKGLSKFENIQCDLVLTKERIHYQEIHKYKVKVHFLKRSKLKKNPLLFFNFFKIVKKVKPDIIHVWGNYVGIISIPTKVLFGIPMINSQIADSPIFVNQSLLSHKITFPFSDQIIANSFAGLKAYGVKSTNASVIYNGFDFNRIKDLEDRSDVINRFSIRTDYVVGMVATFSEKKDYSTYLKAANIVLESFQNVSFLCIGAGNYDDYLEIVEKKNQNKILFLGEQKNVEGIMNICDIGVLATYTEGISNSLMEFSALGKPVVTNFGGGNKELVKEGVTGFLVNQESPVELSDRILSLLENSELRESMGVNGKMRISTIFSLDKMVSDFMKIYDNTLTLNLI